MSGVTSDRLRQLDTESRRIAQREFCTPIVLEAGAGTGKTATLVARVIAWCVGPGWERALAQISAGGRAAPSAERVAERALGRVVAITFTEAAAAEMATRVDAALRELEAGALPIGVDDEALPAAALRGARAGALRAALDHLVVQTIHAYCRRLLAAHPFDAGVHPQLEIDASGRVRAAQVREVVERRLREAYAAPGDTAALRLAAYGIGPLEIEREANALLEQGADAALLARDPFAPDALRAAHARLRSAFDSFRAVAGERLHSVARGPLTRATAAALARSEALLAEPPADAPALERCVEALGSLWDDSTLGRLRDWGKQKFSDSERAALAPQIEAFAAVSAPLARALVHWVSLDVPRYAALCEVLSEVLADVDAALARRGVIGFSKLLSQAAALLRVDASVARRVRRQIDQLLVDEFQDTDRRQCEIVAAIALEGPPDERPGLFLVGDPKQSIYGWRSADLSAYEAFVSKVRAAGGAVHPLAVNFRSLPAILEEVERVIAPLMRREPGLQPEFTALLPSAALAAAPAVQGLAPVEYWISFALEHGAPRETTAAAATALEARALAADLRRLHDTEGIAWSDIAVLFRSRGDWDVYLGALREAGVPFAVEGDRSHFRRREIIDAAALVRCVLDPSDHLALLSMLRSSAVGVPDAALLPLWRMGLPSLLSACCAPDAQREQALRRTLETLADRLPADVPGLERVRGWEQNLLHAATALAALRECFEREPGDVFVERLRGSLLLEASEAARFLGSWRVANLERFFRLLSEELAGGADTHSVLRRLRSAVAEEEPAEEGQPRDLTADAVRVLTLHGAKGLDFACVYLMQLHKDAGRRNTSTSELREHDGSTELCLSGAPSLGWDRAEYARSRVAEAESVRTLYVGLTRARVRLVLAGLWPAFQRRGAARSHASLLTSRRDAPPDLHELFDACVREGGHGVDAHGARWVFPALAAPAAAAPPRAADAAPQREQIQRDVAQLRAARAWAEARMQRPLSQAASAQEEALEAAGEVASQASPGVRIAQLVGTAVHHSLEHLDLGADPEAELARADQALAAFLRASAPPQHCDAALREAHARLAALAGGRLLGRLRALREHIVARELPVLLAAEPGDGAVALLTGAIDLVYRDPDTGELVIADYKTDRIADAADLAVRTHRYAQQGAVYQRALRTALGLAAPPRFELWYLSADRLVDATEVCARLTADGARG
jgi:ATP-dependent exoDNAse (exonuclease V) beta subunit